VYRPVGIALDFVGGKIYWTNNLAGTIQRANFDGNGIEDIVTGLSVPQGIALDVQVTVDTTPPVITPNVSGSLGNDGWYISDVTVNWTITDPESGIASSTGCDPTTLTTDTAGTILICSATNGAGLSNSASVTVKLDKTAPDIIITSPGDGASYLFNAAVASSYNCTDATSGVSTCNGPVVSSGNFDTSPVGAHTFTVTAVDVAGNQAQLVHYYSAIYDFSGFFAPVDNPPTLNNVKAGRAIPVKFSLNGDQGLDILDAGFPASQQIACDASATLDDVEETVASGSSSLSYDATSDQYIYVWKTDKGWAGTCHQLIVQLNDGTAHVAYFNFR
jgi:hypothetical protein